MGDKKLSFGKVNITIGELFYYLFWILMLFVKGVGWYDGMPVYKICFIIAIFCIGIKICYTEHTVAEWIFITLLSGLGLIAYLNSREKGILLAIMMIIGIKGIPVRRLFQIGLVVWGPCFVIMNVLGVFDIVTGPIFAQNKNGLGIVLRKSLGYTHPNVLHVTYAVLLAFILYLSIKKSIWKYIVLFLGNIYVFLYSFSYTGFLMVMLLLLMDIYMSYRRNISRLESILLQSILPACMIFSVVGPMVLDADSALFQLINKLMNVRFFASRVFLSENPLSVLGVRFRTENWALDSSYVALLLQFGVLFFVLFFALFFNVIRNCIRQDDRKGLSLTIPFLIGGVIEPFLVNTSFKNLTWIIAGIYLYESLFSCRIFSVSDILSKKILLLKKWNYVLKIPIIKLDDCYQNSKTMFRKWQRPCFVLVTAAGVLGGIFAYFFISIPDEIYIGRQNTERIETVDYYLDMDNLPDDFMGTVYAYIDPKSPLLRLDKEQLYFEHIRKVISIGIGIMGITCLLLLTFLIVLQFDTGVKKIYVHHKWRLRKVRYGSEHPDQTFYVIRRSTGNTGLFSYVMTNMGHVRYALEKGYIPVIDMQNNKNTYLYDEEIGSVNAWELFFDQPCGYQLKDINQSRNVILSSGIIDGKIPYPSMEMIRNQKYLAEWRNIFNKSFKIKPEIKKEIDRLYKDLLADKKVLGVLCRGTDYIYAKPPRHPVQPLIEELMDKVKTVLKESKCEAVYLVTEDEEIYQLFKRQFQDKLIVTAAKRYQSAGKTNINDIIEAAGEDKYTQGKAYLINIALLSRCNCLVAGCTGGTYGALLISKGYEYQYIFDLGLY